MTLDGTVPAERHPFQLPVNRPFTFGQIAIQPLPEHRFRLSHRSDAENAENLQRFTNPEDALELSRFDNTGRYRPLKTAPNLRRGWILELATADQVWRALDHFYPGRLGVLGAYRANRLFLTSLRETLGRQTGMYRIAATISDARLEDVVGQFCRSDGGCLRTILWKRDNADVVPSTKLPPQKFDPAYDQAVASSPIMPNSVHIPLLCQEACNLLVAECRKAVKERAG